jgi:hypothetical protein
MMQILAAVLSQDFKAARCCQIEGSQCGQSLFTDRVDMRVICSVLRSGDTASWGGALSRLITLILARVH